MRGRKEFNMNQNENEIKKRIEWGEFTMHPKYNVPVLDMKYGDDVVGYMSPFRGYHFQISQTYDGSYNMGTSYDSGVPLYNRYRGLPRDLVRDVYKALVASCVLSYLGSTYGTGKEPSSLLMYHNEVLDKFIEASIDFIDSIRR